MESCVLVSKYLKRKVLFEVYYSFHEKNQEPAQLVFFNDGQDLIHCHLPSLFHSLMGNSAMKPLMVVAIHAGRERKQEYGVAGCPDFKNRGAKAGSYASFILEELIPHLEKHFHVRKSIPKSYAGFSLGGLSALDMVWDHPHIFQKAGVFSGSLWWRRKGLEDGYQEDADRIMLCKIKEGRHYPKLKFFFECGTKDETEDRNNNGIIDVIDDTLDVIDALVEQGYSYPGDIVYHEIPGGNHDLQTWKKALPEFFHFLCKD